MKKLFWVVFAVTTSGAFAFGLMFVAGMVGLENALGKTEGMISLVIESLVIGFAVAFVVTLVVTRLLTWLEKRNSTKE